MKSLTRDAVIAQLERLVNELGSQKYVADHLGVSTGYLCDVLQGRREPGDRILSAMGLRRVILYESTR